MSDLQASVAFYVHKVGFALLSQAINESEQEAYTFLALGELRLELIEDHKAGRFARPDGPRAGSSKEGSSRLTRAGAPSARFKEMKVDGRTPHVPRD